LNIAPNEAI